MIATLVPEPGSTPIADVYRALANAAAHTEAPWPAFRATDYDPVSVREASVRWHKRMVDEYGSTTVFSGLVAQLVEANASLDASVVALRMAQDEFRHAEICGRVVRTLGGDARARRETAVRPLPLHADCSVEERALRNVLVTSISETYSAAFFVASLERMACPFLRAVTRELLTDEVLHARFGLYYLSGCADWLAARPDVRASVSRYLRVVFAACEREFVKTSPDREAGADASALGLLDRAESREVFMDTMEHAVVRALERFGLEAARAFRAATSHT